MVNLKGVIVLLSVFTALPVAAQLPAIDGEVYIAAQEWVDSPGPRSVKASVHYPNGSINSVRPTTGVMVILHNWGGEWCDWAANPRTMADTFDVVSICVDYLQSGDAAFGPNAYEFGLLQAGDALRALRHVYVSLPEMGFPFHKGRIYTVGASGGGHVALMANKLAPRTFAGVVAIAPLVKLNSDIALGLPGGSPLNARWGALPDEHAEIRFVGNPAHLKAMKKLGTKAHVLLVHGVTDSVAPFSEVQELHGLMALQRMRVYPFWVHEGVLDGLTFSDTGHALGHRTLIAISTGANVLRAVRPGKTDFDKRDAKVRYPVTGGTWVVNHSGPAVIGFTHNRRRR